MPEKISQAETAIVTRRDGSTFTVQEWPTLVAMDALDDIVEGYDDLKEQGVIDKVMNLRLTGMSTVVKDEDGNVDADSVEIDRSSQADQFIGILKVLKGYRGKVLTLVASAIVVQKSHDDITEKDLAAWFTDELYDLFYAVYEVNFVKGSLKKVRQKIEARQEAQTTVQTSDETLQSVEPALSETP